MGVGIGRRRSSIGMALLTGAVLVGVSACGGNADAKTSASDNKAGSASSAKASPDAKPSPSKPTAPPMLLDTIVPRGGTVGVAQPISVVFSNPVAKSARADVEKHLKITTSKAITGAWHWFSDTRVDFRPENYWPSGTKVSLNADMTGVKNGNGRVGVHGYQHSFTIGDDVEAKVSVKGHTMTVTKNGAKVRTLAIDAGNPKFPTWDGTMAVIDKAKKVHMTSCSVGISCTKGSPNYYDITLPWDVHLTTSGTYIHYSTGDPNPGHGYGSHGCVHLSMADAKWFYNYVKAGDPVTVTGSPRGKAKGDNGYADYNLSWSDWLSESGAGQITTTVG
ncbi:L,D-transpeptidase [Streptomyces bomunensis]|uniref:L,D-transpeptidase n=2 Tax=Streptomyces montanisoli TaxID=2798581 RepID=A0A940M9T1_9ACTN|nr:L,D-transpeptidase [Streptomyces montanisoli]MBP0456988.1 L,D-transpeptidase [Streptomyces montanisoli]